MTKRWEYEWVNCKASNAGSYLRKLGNDGWELVTALDLNPGVDSLTLIFKRPGAEDRG